ncbi:glycan-binding surface protein [Terrimonas alba]|uniref:glycan-binding surface protein n=1 Tax=Terrimonas alba TaxID=3349636 RepID=UPI0035F2F498
MNKILKHRLNVLSLFIIMIAALLSACKKNISDDAPPVITEVRSYEASPNDTILNSLEANGQWVVISGQNLKNAIEIKFNGVRASFNGTLFAGNSAVVQIPTILFSTIDTTKLYTIEYTTTGGSTTFAFKLGPGAPTISAISNVFADPGDSVFIYGTDLVLVQSFSYGGDDITSFKSDLYGTSLRFKMPNPAPTSGNVVVTTKSGTAIFKIEAIPTITAISNENANTDDSVYVYGTYLKSIQSFTFSGANITSFVTSSDGSFVAFKLPSISQSGPASITTAFGAVTTVYDVYNAYNVKWAGNATTGILANMEWGNAFGWQWWGGSRLSVVSNGGWITDCPEMTGNTGMFISIKDGPLAAGASGSQIPIGGALWMPAANLTDPVGNWALKFEVNIPSSWNGGSIRIQTGFTSSYTALYEPWQISPTTTTAYSTNGWRTVTIPLSRFLSTDATLGEGRGTPVTSLSNLLGTGNTGCNVMFKNYGTSTTTTGFYGGFDNFRVVKIK